MSVCGIVDGNMRVFVVSGELQQKGMRPSGPSFVPSGSLLHKPGSPRVATSFGELL